MTLVTLRPTLPADLDFVLAAEQDEQNRRWILPWERSQHQSLLEDPDWAHWIIIAASTGGPVGFVILAGRTNPNHSVELKRIVVTQKGQGYGRATLRLVQQQVFEQWQAHRLWLDVKEHNERARWLYESVGFVVEGVLRECLKVEVSPKDPFTQKYESLVLLSLLRREYLALSRSMRPIPLKPAY